MRWTNRLSVEPGPFQGESFSELARLPEIGPLPGANRACKVGFRRYGDLPLGVSGEMANEDLEKWPTPVWGGFLP